MQERLALQSWGRGRHVVIEPSNLAWLDARGTSQEVRTSSSLCPHRLQRDLFLKGDCLLLSRLSCLSC